jgi:hypothetical protein
MAGKPVLFILMDISPHQGAYCALHKKKLDLSGVLPERSSIHQFGWHFLLPAALQPLKGISGPGQQWRLPGKCAASGYNKGLLRLTRVLASDRTTIVVAVLVRFHN